jgi:hypothetical protein
MVLPSAALLGAAAVTRPMHAWNSRSWKLAPGFNSTCSSSSNSSMRSTSVANGFERVAVAAAVDQGPLAYEASYSAWYEKVL